MSKPDSASFAARTFRNVAWLGGSQVLRQGVSLLATIVLARFLAPGDYGLFVMTFFVNELAQLLINFGLGAALVQRKEVSDQLLSSCFWISLGVGAVAGGLLIAAGPLVADFFGQPLIRWLLVASAANVLAGALAVVPYALIARRLELHEAAVGTVVGSVVGALSAVGLAVAGLGVWALVMQPLIGTTATTVFLYVRTRWRPRWTFSLAEVLGMLTFSGHLLGSNVLAHVTRNLQSLILGPAMGAAALGLIGMAQTVVWLPLAQIGQAVVKATFPVFSKLQDEPPRAKAALYRSVRVIAFLSFPLLAGIGVLAPDLMPVAFGPQWASSAPLVGVLCAAAMVKSATTLSDTILISTGRTSQMMWLSLFGLGISAAFLWSARTGPVLHGVVAMAVPAVMLQLTSQALALRAIGGRWREFASCAMRPLVGSSIMVAGIAGARPFLLEQPALVRLVVLSLAGAALYTLWSALASRALLADLLGLAAAKLKSERGA